MKNIFRSAVASLLFASVFGGIAMQSANAATITWGSATTISGTTDVNTEGTLFAATSFDSTGPFTVNGVTFSAWSGQGSGTISNGTFSIFGEVYVQYDNTTFQSVSSPFSSLPTEYKNLLGGAMTTQSNNPNTFTISGLTNGQEYSIQLWASDPRDIGQARTMNVDGITLDFNTNPGNTAGGLGQWIRGTFTANAATQSFGVTPNISANFNAIQVRVVPEPEMLAGLGVIGSGLAAFIRRRLQTAKSAS